MKSARFIILFPLVSVVVLSLYLEGGVWRTAGWVVAGVTVVAGLAAWRFKRPAG
ncbi:MAG TPA: hypothetical protein VJQ82_06150 [Terriglobales bacterium]|nr:hypothetical protein [Terriglobales bacterium]